MSLRRDCAEGDAQPWAARSIAPPMAFAPASPTEPVTIASSLGIANPGPAKPFVPFAPQYPVPQSVGSVVNDAFGDHYGYDVDPTGLFGKKKGAAAAAPVKGAKKGGMLSNLKVAKDKANATVRKAASGAKSGAKSLAKRASDLVTGLSHFDYKLYSDTFTALLGVAKKDDGINTDSKNNYAAFAGDSKYKKVVKIAQMQEAKMTHTESLQKNVKGRDSKVIKKKAEGRNAATLGFAQVEASAESKERYGDVIYPPAATVGIPTLVTLTVNDTNGTKGMLPITGLVVEALDVANITKGGDGNIAINMAEVKEIKMQASQEALTSDEFEFEWTLCVHGLHVDEQKNLHNGPMILVPKSNMNNVSAYGIATKNGVESALSHAIKGDKIDLLLLWTAFKLVQGAQDLAYASINSDQRKAAQELFGSLDGANNQNSYSEDVDADEFDELNAATIM
jgi:hypothetical protein